MTLRSNILELTFASSNEIVRALCERLRKERLAQQLTQADVAARAGISANTVSNLEAGKNVAFENVVRIAMLLGRANELEALFKPKLDSLDDILRYEHSAGRKRIRKKLDNA